jgi:hypothetical protein
MKLTAVESQAFCTTLLVVSLVFVFPTRGQEDSKLRGQKTDLSALRFPNGPVELELNDKWFAEIGDNNTVNITPEPNSGIVLSLNLHTEPKEMGPGMAKQFLQSQANKKRLKTQKLGNKLAISEASKGIEKGKSYTSTHWQIVVGDYLVVATIEIDDRKQKDRLTETAKDDMRRILGSLRVSKVGG